MPGRKTNRLGHILLASGKITREQLDYVLELQKERKDKLGKILIDEGMVSENEIVEALGHQLGIPSINLDRTYIGPEITRLVPKAMARKYNLIPIKRDRGILTVAMNDPLDLSARDAVKLATGLDVQPAIVSRGDIEVAIEYYYGKQAAEEAIEDLKREYRRDNNAVSYTEALNQISSAPAVRLVNSIIEQAVLKRASDIHIEPGETGLRVRFRIDGDLQEVMNTSMDAHRAMVTRIKIMSNLNIAESRVPQDGRVEMETGGRNLDLRVSVLPSVHGEKAVIRILNRNNTLMSWRQLGLNEENIRALEGILKAPYGMILVTGPTGSGKTTTLYTVLKELNRSAVNIITIEDPVEYRLEGINQVQVNPKAGLTFATGLRSILRQDPDIIMVGEIRDEDTANLAVRAAITGHLVLSTLHTNDAAGAVIRLVDMGAEPYLVASSAVAVISQRLVRKLCPRCKEGYTASREDLHMLDAGIDDELTLYRSKGCPDCNGSGYLGRTGVYEIMEITKSHRDLINRKVSSDRLLEVSVRNGMETLKGNCARLVINGITSMEEMIKAVYVQK